MSRINEIIASMPPGEAAAVVHLREVHSCLMELDTKKARTLAARAVFLDYIEGTGRKLGKIHDTTKGLLLREKRLTWKLTSVTLIEYIKPQKLWQTVKSLHSIREAATIASC